MSENLNIDAAMLNQLPPEVQALIINMIKGGQNAAVPQAGPSEMNKGNTGESRITGLHRTVLRLLQKRKNRMCDKSGAVR